jgi:hypothetical protein
MPTRILVLLVSAIAVASGAAAARQSAPRTTLPPAVRTAFERAYPTGTIDHWAAEEQEGRTVFEIESHEGRQKRDLLYAPDGHHIEVAEAMAPGDLPAVVRQTVGRAYPGARPVRAARVVRGPATTFEIQLTGATVKAVEVAADGTLRAPVATASQPW